MCVFVFFLVMTVATGMDYCEMESGIPFRNFFGDDRVKPIIVIGYDEGD